MLLNVKFKMMFKKKIASQPFLLPKMSASRLSRSLSLTCSCHDLRYANGFIPNEQHVIQFSFHVTFLCTLTEYFSYKITSLQFLLRTSRLFWNFGQISTRHSFAHLRIKSDFGSFLLN